MKSSAWARFAAIACLALVCSCQVSKETWMKRLGKTAPDEVCAQTFFASCYNMGKQKCMQTARPIIDQCMKELESSFPDHFDPESGEKWGRKVGECAGGRLATASSQYLEVSPECAEYMKKTHGPESVEALRAEAAAATK
jgi:hypothetical protein